MKKKILVVDDESGLLAMTVLRLNKSGYEAFGAPDARAALDLARHRVPDLILVDVVLPGMFGDEVVRILKKDEKLKHLPVILISAVTEILEERVSKSGADGYLPKPFGTKELLGTIERHLTPCGRRAKLLRVP